MEVNKQLFASIVGILIVAFHIALLGYLWLKFGSPTGTGPLQVTEIATPITAAFALGVVKWVIDTQGHITSPKTVGLPFVIILTMVGVALAAGLFWGVRQYVTGAWQPKELNMFFVTLESGIGGMFGLFFNDMFGPPVTDADAAGNVAQPGQPGADEPGAGNPAGGGGNVAQPGQTGADEPGPENPAGGSGN